MKDLTPEEEALPLKALKALEAVLLFHSGSPWDEQKELEWQEAAVTVLGPCVAGRYHGTADRYDATTRVLCNMVRSALGKELKI